jgi:thiamine transporter
VVEKRNISIKFIVESGVMVALATILSYIKIYHMPQGGSLTAGSMVPIILVGLRYGVKKGLLVGIVYGVLQSILEPFVVHPVQYLLDYPIAFGLLGLSGIGKSVYSKMKSRGIGYYGAIVMGIFLAIAGRFAGHVTAGAIFFKEYAGDQNAWVYSAIYNGSFLSLELLISVVIIVLIWKPLERIGAEN